MKLLAVFSKRALYLLWTMLSGVLLAIACAVDPYIFAFAAFGAAGVSGAMILAALILGRRQIGWALLSALPTVAAFALLSNYKWA